MSRQFRSPVASLAALLCFGLLVQIGRSYEAIGAGLHAHTPQGPFLCRELMSSGSDDDVMVGELMLYAFPFALRLLRFLRPPSRIEFAVYAATTGVVGFAFLLAWMDCGNVFYTAFAVPDPVLAAALGAMALSGALIAIARRSGQAPNAA